jgi:hypothetical protein
MASNCTFLEIAKGTTDRKSGVVGDPNGARRFGPVARFDTHSKFAAGQSGLGNGVVGTQFHEIQSRRLGLGIAARRGVQTTGLFHEAGEFICLWLSHVKNDGKSHANLKSVVVFSLRALGLLIPTLILS